MSPLLTALAACTATTTGAPCASAPPEPLLDADVRAALADFLRDFENLDGERFRAHFADDACVFFPTAKDPERVCGKPDVAQRFARVFEAEREASTATSAPFLRLEPLDLVVQPLGADAAVASFHLRNERRTARRTVVFRRAAAGLVVVHLHGSNVPWPDVR